MATAKPAAKPTEEPEVKEPETPSDDETKLRATITEVVKDIISAGPPEPPEGEPSKEPSKPMTAREEEERTYNIVSEAIKTFKDEVKEMIGKKEETKEPETKPHENEGFLAWLRKAVWGIE